MPDSLYQRLGGVERIATLVEDALDRHAVNPLLAPRLRGTDLPRLAQLGVQLFCAGAGGPQHDGLELRAAQAGLDISEEELLATMDDVVAALEAQGVAPAEVNEVIAFLYSLKGDVVRL